MKRIAVLLSCLLSVFLILTVPLFAQPEQMDQMEKMDHPEITGRAGHMRHQKISGNFDERVLARQKELGLSEKQITDIQNARREMRKDLIKLQADRKIKRLELQELLQQTEINFEQVRVKEKEINAIDEKIALRRVDNWEKIYNILTPEQKSKLKEIKSTK